MKIALGIEYCGYHYHGWQKQDAPNSIQEHVESALSKIANRQIKVYCAGRTDAGVHASQQVLHLETKVKRTMYTWVVGSNTYLPEDISILWAKQVDSDFHARYSVVTRTYRYIIINRQARPGLHYGKVTWEPQQLDELKMQMAATALVGEHDFTAYRTAACQAKTPVRKVKKLDISRSGDYIVLEIEANAFLHHMVRNIAGVLLEIGIGKKPPAWAAEVLAMKDRKKAAKTASAAGLYLAQVKYPSKYNIPLADIPKWVDIGEDECPEPKTCPINYQ